MSPEKFIANPNLADFLPEMRDSAKRRHLPAHEDCVRLDADEVAAHLLPGGALGRLPHHEVRAGQLDMLRAIVRAYDAREHLMVEAGTGVGKSLAYLVPSILWAWANDTPVVISTATRNLQSQLMSSDIPRAVSVLGENESKFKVALLKGRTNYLCLRAVADFFAAGFWTMQQEEQDEMPHFIEWLQTTSDGDLDQYEGLPRNLLTCPGEECSVRKCPWYSRCFVYHARKRAAEAHLIVANHALIFSEATCVNSGVLPAYNRLVLDEAHNLEEIATDYLSREFSVPALTQILNRLVRKKRKSRIFRGGGTTGTFAAIERLAQRVSLEGGTVVATKIRETIADASVALTRILAAAEHFATCAKKLFLPLAKADLVRYKCVNEKRAYSVRGIFQAYDETDWDENEFRIAHLEAESEIASLITRLHVLRDTLNNAVKDDEMNPFAEVALQVNGSADALISFANTMDFLVRAEKESHVFWIEKCTNEKRASFIRLVAAPLSVANDLRKILYEPKDSVILSSATLRVGNDFRYMATRLGCDLMTPGSASAAAYADESDDAPRFRALTASSPFDYLRQSLVLAPDYLPDPATQSERYEEELANFLAELTTRTHGRALVLFTSYEMMQHVAARVREKFANEDVTLLVQGEGLSREAMTQALRHAGNSRVVLFGAQSFWEGVDVAGDALSCVVLARLPFAMVGDPIIEARGEKITREGGSAFRDYSLPEAAIKFRQGFGRLIRSARDRGIVVMTDSRIVTKNYGAIFRKSIPTTVHTMTDQTELLTRVTDFFASDPTHDNRENFSRENSDAEKIRENFANEKSAKENFAKNKKSRKRGSALLLVLMTIAVLSIMVMSFVYEARQQSGINIFVRERNRVLRVVDAGQAIAEVVMSTYKDAKDWTPDLEIEKELKDDRWWREKSELKTSGSCRIGPILLDQTLDEDGSSYVNPLTVTIEIGAANENKININTLWKNGNDQKYMERWWMIFNDHNIPEKLMTPDEGEINLWNRLIASWEDWRDEDDTVTAIDGEECGAENSWYEEDEDDRGLDRDEYREFRRRPRNGPIPDIHELENVRGFRDFPAVLTGGVLNPWEDDKDQQIFVRSLLDVLGTDGPTKVNINARPSASVLLTIPGIFEHPEADDALEEARDVANKILNALDEMPSDRDVDPDRDMWPFEDWNDLTKRVEEDVGSEASNYLDYKTEQFKIKIIGESLGMKHQVEARCYVKDGKVRYYEWCENPVEPNTGKGAQP